MRLKPVPGKLRLVGHGECGVENMPKLEMAWYRQKISIRVQHPALCKK
jgi:hypothetical protein